MKTLPLILSVLSFLLPSIAKGDQKAFLTISGIVHPAFKATIFLTSNEDLLQKNSQRGTPLVVIQCDKTFEHQVIVESGGLREILHGQRRAQTTDYVVTRPAEGKTICVTVISQ